MEYLHYGIVCSSKRNEDKPNVLIWKDLEGTLSKKCKIQDNVCSMCSWGKNGGDKNVYLHFLATE